MTSKEKIRDIKSVINEFYHQMKCEGKLTECANECWKSYQKYCDDIEKELDRLEITNKNNEGLVRDNVKLINRNLELEKELKRCQEYIQKSVNDHKNLIIDNSKMKKAIEILKNKRVNIPQLLKTTFIVYNSLALLLGYDKLTQEEYELLKGVLE